MDAMSFQIFNAAVNSLQEKQQLNIDISSWRKLSYLGLAHQKFPNISFLQQLLHPNKSWQEAQHISHNA